MPTSKTKALAPWIYLIFPSQNSSSSCIRLDELHPPSNLSQKPRDHLDSQSPHSPSAPQRMNHQVLFSLTIQNLSGLNLLLQPTAPLQASINALRSLELPPIWFPDSRCYAHLPLIPAATVKIPKTQNVCSILSTVSKNVTGSLSRK